MQIRPLQQSDLDYMAQHARDRDYYKQIPGPTEFPFVLEHEGNPLVVGGFKLITATTAWCWVDFSDIGLSNIYTSFRAIDDWIEIFCERHGVLRLEAAIECDGRKETIRFVEHLNFACEHTSKHYFGSNDAMIYVRFFPPRS